jgi:hypothetical protein
MRLCAWSAEGDADDRMARRGVRWCWRNKPRVEIEFSVEVGCLTSALKWRSRGAGTRRAPPAVHAQSPCHHHLAGGICSGFSGDEGIAPSTPVTGRAVKESSDPTGATSVGICLRGRGRFPSTNTFQLTAHSTTRRICLLHHTQCSATAPAPLLPAPGAWPMPPAPTPSPCPRRRVSPTASSEVCFALAPYWT